VPVLHRCGGLLQGAMLEGWWRPQQRACSAPFAVVALCACSAACLLLCGVLVSTALKLHSTSHGAWLWCCVWAIEDTLQGLPSGCLGHWVWVGWGGGRVDLRIACL
jgi:hypothetical protein